MIKHKVFSVVGSVLSWTVCVALGSALLAPAPSFADELKPEGDVPTVVLRVPDKDPQLYRRLDLGSGATFNVCGQGKAEVLSRALIDDGASAARYVIDLAVDGRRPAQELGHRVPRVDTVRFDEAGSGALRRDRLKLTRGCHTLKLSLARSTTPAVAVRVRFDEERPTKRSWQDLDPPSAFATVPVRAGDRTTSYRRLPSGESLEVEVQGPAWLRLRLRPLLERRGAEPSSYRVEVRRKDRRDRTYRSYEVDGKPARGARIVGDDGARPASADEIVFPVGPGTHSLRVTVSRDVPSQEKSRDVLVRLQRADAPTDPLPDMHEGWTTTARLTSYYDSNILRYSDKFIQRFDRGEDPDRFRVESLDDVVHRVDVGADRRFTGLAGREARLSVDASHRAYQRNSIKDWTRWQIGLRQDLGRGRWASWRVVGLPDFYIRHLRDSDLVGAPPTDRFQAFELEKWETVGTYSHRLGHSSRLRYELGWARVEHADTFREFDSTDLSLAVRLDHRLSRRVRGALTVELIESDARGYDEAGETLATSDDTDPTYRQTNVAGSLRFRLPGERYQSIFLQAQAGIRDYTTDKPVTVAPLHAGREDEILRLYAAWELELTERLRLTVFGQSRDRSSSAPIDLDIGVEKDYDQYELGVRLGARWD